MSSCSGFIVLTPQHNWGYPGELKNALDHLYWEWRGKPVMLVTYGGHGGGKCASQLKEVMEGGLKMRVVSAVEITLPEEYIRKGRRVTFNKGEENESMSPAIEGHDIDTFLLKYQTLIEEALKVFGVDITQVEQNPI